MRKEKLWVAVLDLLLERQLEYLLQKGIIIQRLLLQILMQKRNAGTSIADTNEPVDS